MAATSADRTMTWLKIKCTMHEEFVGGWRPSNAGRGMALIADQIDQRLQRPRPICQGSAA